MTWEPEQSLIFCTSKTGSINTERNTTQHRNTWSRCKTSIYSGITIARHSGWSSWFGLPAAFFCCHHHYFQELDSWCEDLLRIFFCHLISLYRLSNCWKKSLTLLPWSSLSVVVNTRILDSSVRYSQMLGTGNTICSIVRSCRTIWQKKKKKDQIRYKTFFFFLWRDRKKRLQIFFLEIQRINRWNADEVYLYLSCVVGIVT